MKNKFLFVALFFLSLHLQAQYRLTWTKQNLNFEVPDVFIVNEDSPQVFDAEAEFYTIEARSRLLNENLEKIEQSHVEILRNLAAQKSLQSFLLGENLSGEQAKIIYARAAEKIGDGLKETPVIIALIVDSKKKIAFELFIYCYDGNETTGMKIIQQLRYTPKS